MYAFLIAFSLYAAVVTDCQLVVEFAIGLNMHKTAPTIFSNLKNSTNCCNFEESPSTGDEGKPLYQIKCNYNPGQVTDIVLTSLNLNGMINTTILSQLSSLTTVNLTSNTLSGPIPNNFPDSILFLDLSGCYFNGSMPSTWPPQLAHLFVNFNQLTGPITSALPTSLGQLDVSGNSMGGDLPTFPDSLTTLYLSEGKSTNDFTGTLRMYNPKIVIINDNHITNIVFQTYSWLSQCNISNNPLLGISALNILKASNCAANGLYAASLLPNSLTLKTNMNSMTASVPGIFFNTSNVSTTVFNAPVGSGSHTDPPPSISFPLVVVILLGGLFVTFLLAVILNKILKTPKLRSKFARKNSYGTLNTIHTNDTLQKNK